MIYGENMKIKNPFVSWMEMDRTKLNLGLGLAFVGLGVWLCSFAMYLMNVRPFFTPDVDLNEGITILYRGLVFIALGLLLSKRYKKGE